MLVRKEVSYGVPVLQFPQHEPQRGARQCRRTQGRRRQHAEAERLHRRRQHPVGGRRQQERRSRVHPASAQCRSAVLAGVHGRRRYRGYQADARRRRQQGGAPRLPVGLPALIEARRAKSPRVNRGDLRSLKRDEIGLNRHRALAPCLSMIFSENRFALFRIML
ncbi:hypothetical protein C7G43_22555 [Bradyrhizobium sp. MOS004]|nr:hypothetical protein C7G43_22555 [Bradyrhizobium sp. MOS004]